MGVGKRLLGGLIAGVLLVMLGGAASALAASSSPLTIATGTHPEDLSVAVDQSGDAVAAWADKSVPGAEVVRWCVVALGGGACSGSGSFTPAGGAPGFTYINGTDVLDEGTTLVILADVEAGTTENESVQEWTSTNGGQSFSAANGGKAVASGNPGGITRMMNAVTLPGGGNIGVGFHTPSEAPTFHSFSLASPTLCGRETTPKTNCADHYATLAAESGVDEVSNDPGNYAANDDGVLGVFRTNYSSGSLACTGGSPFGMAFVFGDGLQSPSNNYNVDPGKADTAWRRGVTLADCGVDYIAVGGGPSGFGVLEDNQITGQTQYHHYDGITNTFDTVPTIVSSAGEQQPSVSQDGAGGVYATYLSGGIGGPVSLSYSYDGGTSWTGPGTLSADPLGAISGLTSAVDYSGHGWASWIENGSVYAQPFTAADAVPPTPTPTPPPPPPAATTAPTKPATAQKAGGQKGPTVTIAAQATSNGETLTFGAGCATVPCTLQATATASETAAAASSTKTHKPKGLTLGKGRFRITKKGTQHLTLKLSPLGRRYFKGKRGKLKVTLAVTQKVGSRSAVTTRALSVDVVRRKRSAR
jgi:hypothetical protein